MREIKLHRIYRHFKGDHYLVEDVATDSETGEPVVIYRKLYGDGSLWVRPMAMFLEPVDKQKYPDCQQEYRFELVDVESVAHKQTSTPAGSASCRGLFAYSPCVI